MSKTDPKPQEPERPTSDPEVRVGVYVCHCGGNIADVVDVNRVMESASGLPGVSVAKTNVFMCSDPAQNMVLEDLKSGKVDRVVIAACSPSLHATTFGNLLKRGGMNPFLLEQANIREQCSWAHHSHEQATDKAATLLNMAVAKARLLAPLKPVLVDATHRALVIGGGVAGLRAARDLAGLGIEVVLVERDPTLGGFARRLDRLYPDEEDAAALIERLIHLVEENPLIEVHTSAEVTHAEGYIGNYQATIQPGDGAQELVVQVGVVVVATGFRTYEPAKKEYGYGRLPQVVTLADVGELLAKAGPQASELTIADKPVRSVGFIHCVGSRQVEGVNKPKPGKKLNTHCSRVCCTATLAAACRLRERFPGLEIHDFYQDIRTYARGAEEYYERASRADVIFHRYAGEAPPKVKKAPAEDDNAVLVTVTDLLTWGEEIEVGVDLLVLAVGMEPAPITSIMESLKLAVSADGFLQEVHPKLRPVEMAVNGVLLAGTSQAPKDICESCASASAAAVKAAAILRRDQVDLPPYVAQVDLARCEGSGACVAECPVDGAVRMVEQAGKQHAEVNEAICNGCGCCVAVCPNRAIDVSGWTLDQFTAMVDAIVAE